MKHIKNDLARAELPAPMTLTLDQLAQVASDTGAMLGAGGAGIGVNLIRIIAGGYPVLPGFGGMGGLGGMNQFAF